MTIKYQTHGFPLDASKKLRTVAKKVHYKANHLLLGGFVITVVVPGYGHGSYHVAAANTRRRVAEVLSTHEGTDSSGLCAKIHKQQTQFPLETNKFQKGDWFLHKFNVWADALSHSNEQFFLHIDADASITAEFSFEKLVDELGDKSIGMVEQKRVLGDHPLEKQDLQNHYRAVSFPAVNFDSRRPNTGDFRYFNTGFVLFRRRALENFLHWAKDKIPHLCREVNGNMVADQDLMQVYANEIAPGEIAELSWRWNHCEWWDTDFPNSEAAVIHMSNFCQGPKPAQMNKLALLSRGSHSREFNDLTVVMVTHNSNDVLGDSLATVFEIPGLRVLIVDNNSLEKPVANETSRVRVIANKTNLGYAKAINIALAQVETEYVVLLNPDAFLTYEVVAEAMESLRLNSKQLLAPDFFDASGSFLPSCREGYSLSRLVDDLIPDPRSYLRRVAEKTSRDALDQDFLWLVGACVFSSKSFLLDIGGLDGDYFLYMEDVELGRRAKGKGLVRSLESPILHLGAQSTRNSATLKSFQLAEARLKYLRRHYGLWPWLLLKCAYLPMFRPINRRN